MSKFLKGLTRPLPPAKMLSINTFLSGCYYEPAPELEEWMRKCFINDDGPLVNVRHQHLQEATIGCVWTNKEMKRGGQTYAAMCEMPMAQGILNRWRVEHLLNSWFGSVPDFVITFDAAINNAVSDATFCAICEHELCHAGQAIDRETGEPKFKKSGDPVFCMVSHEIEEFVCIPERYGVQNSAGAAVKIFEAMKRGPTIAQADIDFACGSCGQRLRMVA